MLTRHPIPPHIAAVLSADVGTPELCTLRHLMAAQRMAQEARRVRFPRKLADGGRP